MAHITGGGITDNLPRVLPDRDRGRRSPRRMGGAAALSMAASGRAACRRDDMLRTFNMGVGLVLVVAESDREQVMTALADAGERAARVIGGVVRGSHPRVRYVAGGPDLQGPR